MDDSKSVVESHVGTGALKSCEIDSFENWNPIVSKSTVAIIASNLSWLTT